MSGAGVDDRDLRSKGRDRALLRGASAVGLVRLATAASSYLGLGMAARFLTKSEFGLLSVLMSIFLFLTMLDLGIGSATTTRLAVSHAHGDFAEMRANIKHALLLLTGLGALIAAVGSISAFVLPWDRWIGGEVTTSLLTVSLILTFVSAGAYLPAAIAPICLGSMQRFATAQFVQAAGIVAGWAGASIVALSGSSVEVFMLVLMTLPQVVSICCMLWVLTNLRKLDTTPARRTSTRYESARFKSIASSSGYFAVYGAAWTVGVGLNTAIVGMVCGLSDAAVFSVAMSLFSPITVIAVSGAQMWPSMSRAVAEGDVTWIRSRYRSGLLLVIGTSSCVAVAMVAVGPWLAELWVGRALVPSRALCMWAAASTIVAAAVSQASVVVTAVEKIKPMAILAVCAAAVGVPAAIALTHVLGPTGALIGSSAASVGILLVGLLVLAGRSLRMLESRTDDDPGRSPTPSVPATASGADPS